MPNLSVQIGADTSKLVQGINNAKQSLDKFITDMHNAAEAGEEVADVSDKQVQSYQNVIQSLEKATDGTKTAKQEQRALAKQLNELKDLWASLSNEARSSDFGRSIAETMSAAKNEIASLKAEMSGMANMPNMGEIKMSALSGGSIKKELRATSNELIALTAQYRAMSDAEKQSAGGQELAKKMDELRAKAGELKDTVGDVSQEISVMASDTPNLDVFNEALGIGADLMSTYSSLVAKLTGDENALKDAIATVMTVQSAANLVTKVTNALQSSSAIMLKVRAVQESAATVAINLKTAAEGRGVIATKAATVAQKAFNAVARANPYVLLAMAVIAVGTALVAFTSKAKTATEQEKKLQEEARKTREATERQHRENETLGNKTGDLISKFMILQTQWKALRTEGEKKKFIEENQSAFESLGVSVNNVNDAYKVFVENAEKVVAALKAIAEAEAYQDLYKDAIKKQAQWGNRDKSISTGDYYRKAHIGDKPSKDEERAAGVKASDHRWISTTSPQTGIGYTMDAGLNEEGVKKINKYREDQARNTRRNLEGEYKKETDYYKKLYEGAVGKAVKARDELSKLGGTPKAKTVGKTGVKTGSDKKDIPTYVPGSLSDLEARLAKIQKDYKDGLIPITKKDEYKKAVDDLQKKIKNKRIDMGLDFIVPETSLQNIEEQLNIKQKEFKLAIDDASRRKIKDEIDILTGQKNAIELRLKPVVSSEDMKSIKDMIADAIRNRYETEAWRTTEPKKGLTKSEQKSEKAMDKLDDYSDLLNINKQIEGSLRTQYKLIQNREKVGGTLSKEELELKNIYEGVVKNIDELTAAYDRAAKSARNLRLESEIKKKTWEGTKTGVNVIDNMTSSVYNSAEAWASLSGKELSKPFTDTVKAIQAVTNSINAAISIYESIIDVIKLFGEISELTAAKKVAANTAEAASDTTKTTIESANTQTKMTNDAAENASEIGKLGVKQASAIASATASGAALPFPANLAAIAAGIAAVVAAFALVFSCFAEGGIVSGGSHIGDKQIVRVNSGEMILNGQQQKRLFNLLNGTDSRNGATVGEGGVVKFKIKGNNLYGVLNNHVSKQKRV